MNTNYLSILLVVTVLSIGIVSSLNLVSAQVSYAPSSTGASSMNSQSTPSGASSMNSQSTPSGASSMNSQSTPSGASSMNSQAGILGSNSNANPQSVTPNSSMRSTTMGTMNSQPNTLAGTLGSNLQLNTGSKTVCINGIMTSEGNCVESQTNPVLSSSSNTGSVFSGAAARVTIVSGAGSGGSNGSCVAANNCFSPSTLTISKGDIVTWTNADTTFHTVTSGYSTGNNVGTLFDKTISPGNSVSISFNNVGSVNYFCRIHPWLTGQVTIAPTQNNVNAQNGTNSQAGIISPTSSAVGTNYGMNSQAGVLAPNSSTQSNTGSNAYCSTGIMNSQGLCSQPTPGTVNSPSSTFVPNSSSSSSMNSQAGVLSPNSTSSNSSMNSQAGVLSPNSTSSNSSMNSQAGVLSPNSTSSNSSMNSQAGVLSPNSTSSSNSSMNSQAGVLSPNSTSSAGANSTSNNSGSQNAVGGNQVTFAETGLHTGWGACWPFWSCVPSWGIMHNGQTNNATSNTLTVSAPSGEYSYVIVSPSGYGASPSSGKLMVSGTTNQTIHFIPNP